MDSAVDDVYLLLPKGEARAASINRSESSGRGASGSDAIVYFCSPAASIGNRFGQQGFKARQGVKIRHQGVQDSKTSKAPRRQGSTRLLKAAETKVRHQHPHVSSASPSAQHHERMHPHKSQSQSASITLYSRHSLTCTHQSRESRQAAKRILVLSDKAPPHPPRPGRKVPPWRPLCRLSVL